MTIIRKSRLKAEQYMAIVNAVEKATPLPVRHKQLQGLSLISGVEAACGRKATGSGVIISSDGYIVKLSCVRTPGSLW